MQNTELADALERHEETSNAELARQMGGELWERGDVLAFSSRAELGTGMNFACRVRSDEHSIETLVDDVGSWFFQRGLDAHFRVSPLTRPATFAQILERRGFTQTETETQMVLAAEDVEPLGPTPAITIEQVAASDLQRWAAIQHAAFGGTGEPPELLLDLARASARAGNSTPYLARVDGIPVGAGTLTEWAGVFGIYGVATAAEARNRGVGTALVRQMIRDVRARGNAPLCLQVQTRSATESWYERLGFRVVYDRTGWTLSLGQLLHNSKLTENENA